MKVSVVVPVYNTSAYLRDCLESLRLQTLDDMEVILVDDGSTDGSEEICDEYAERYPGKFKVSHKANGGSASARQSGWDMAKGEFITVCDSDDYVEHDMYERLYNAIDSSEIAISICDTWLNYPDGSSNILAMPIDDSMACGGMIPLALRHNWASSSCNKLFRRSIFTDNGLRWPEGINLGEDSLMLLKILKSCPHKTVKKINRPLYHYRRRPGENTYTNSLTIDKWHQMEQVQQWRKAHLAKEYPNGVNSCTIDLLFAALRLNDETLDFKTATCGGLSIADIIKADASSMKKTVAIVAKLLGAKTTKCLVRSMYSFFYK